MHLSSNSNSEFPNFGAKNQNGTVGRNCFQTKMRIKVATKYLTHSVLQGDFGLKIN